MENKIKINCVIGVDPGAAGGIAVYIPNQKTKAVKMPKDITELLDFFLYYAENYKPIVFLEKLSVRPDDIKADGDKPNMGKLYRVQRMIANYEHLKAIIESAGVPYVLTHPMTWQSALNLRVRGVHEEKADRKRRYCATAAKLYPEIKTTLWNADALLILHFGRWALVNNPKWVKGNLPDREYNKLF